MKKTIFNIIEKHSLIKRAELLKKIHAEIFLQDIGTPINDYISDRQMRRTIEEMITEDGYLIASGEQGYYIIHNSTQLADAQKYLRAKAFPLFNRASKLHASFFKGENAQLSIEEFLQKT